MIRNRHRIFLIDSAGALLTFCILWFLLRAYPQCFGMPVPVVKGLAAGAAGLALFGSGCYGLVKTNFAPFILVLVTANGLYCATTLGLMLYHWKGLTLLAVLYFVTEILLILLLVRVELFIAAGKNDRR